MHLTPVGSQCDTSRRSPRKAENYPAVVEACGPGFRYHSTRSSLGAPHWRAGAALRGGRWRRSGGLLMGDAASFYVRQMGRRHPGTGAGSGVSWRLHLMQLRLRLQWVG